MSRVAVSANVLRWALRRSGLSPEDLERTFPHLVEWERGEAQPTLRQLEALAQRTRTQLGFFFLAEPPNERFPVPYYRTLGDKGPHAPGPDFVDTVHMMERRQGWMREFLLDQGHGRLGLVGSANVGEPTTAVVPRMRRALGLPAGWAVIEHTAADALRRLREAMAAIGILVVVNGVVGNNTHRPLDPDEFRGFILIDEHVPLVFVNGADAKGAQLFTLAHDLAHVFVGAGAAFDLREMEPADNRVERVCNHVAAEFLVPERELRELWPGVETLPEPFRTVARRFKVSELVSARRALDLGLVGVAQFQAFYRTYKARERSDPVQHGGNFYANQQLRIGHRFGSAVVQAVREGTLPYSEAYELTGLYGTAFDRYAARLDRGEA